MTADSLGVGAMVGQDRYREIFDATPVSLWDMDFSGIAALLKRWRAEGTDDLRAYLVDHPDEVEGAIRRVRVLDANSFTFDLFEVDRNQDLLPSLAGILLPDTASVFIDMLVTLANLPEPPESVPINMLIPIPGTPLAKADPVGPIEFVRVVALARIMMPTSFVRLSAGRSAMSDEMQAMCFFAGANSIFVGDTLLTAGNPEDAADRKLFGRLGLEAL